MALTWNKATLPANGNWSAVTHTTGNTFLAISSSMLAKSTDGGKTWIQKTGVSATMYDIAHGNGITVMSIQNGFAYSTNEGESWTTVSMPTTYSYLCYDETNKVFVAIGAGTLTTARSSDGKNWTTVSNSTSAYPIDIAAGNGKIVVIVSGEKNTCYVSSNNGQSFSEVSLTHKHEWNTVGYGNGTFILLSGNGACARGDGNSFTASWLPGYTNCNKIAYGNGNWVAIAKENGTYLQSTDNGANWTATYLDSSLTYGGIAYGNNSFVMVCTSSSNVGFYVSMNQAPTQPTSISATEPIKGGSATTVSWGTSSDTDGNLAGYKLERSINGGSWTQIYQGTATSHIDSITYGTSTVAYRVKAYDGAGAESAYTTSPAYSVFNNVAPSMPENITIPSTIKGGTTINISWAASTDSNSNLAGYMLERSLNGGAYIEIYRGANTTYTDTIVYGTSTVSYRVKAYDSEGAASAYKESATVTVINNTAPVISGSDGNLGSFTTTPLTVEYTITDAQSDSVTVVEKFDGVTINTFVATLGATNTITWSAEDWLEMLNGAHTITITATDPDGASSTRILAFTKSVNEVSFFSNPVESDNMPNRCVVSAVGSFPEGSVLTIEVSNNANDINPIWEDISDNLGLVHYFVNEVKTSTHWAFGIHVTLSRGTAIDDVYLDEIDANFSRSDVADLSNYYTKEETRTEINTAVEGLASEAYVDERGIKVLEASTENVIDFNTLTESGYYLIKNANENTTLNSGITGTTNTTDIHLFVIFRKDIESNELLSVYQYKHAIVGALNYYRSFTASSGTWSEWKGEINAAHVKTGTFPAGVSCNTPTATTHLANKSYVDTEVAKKADTTYVDEQVANKATITYGTTDLTAGTSELATGVVYLCYE